MNRNHLSLLSKFTPAALVVAAALHSPFGFAQESASAAHTAAPKSALMTSRAVKGLIVAIAQKSDGLVAVGGNGIILKSKDAATWNQQPCPVDVELTAIQFVNDQRGWAVGHDATILGTSDGGESWHIESSQPEIFSPLFSLQALSDKTVIAVGAFGLIKRTNDDGKSWTTVEDPVLTTSKLHLNAIKKLNNQALLVVGEKGLIAYSVNGETWSKVSSPYEGSFFGIEPNGANGALIYGMRGNVYITDNVATGAWKKLETGTTNSLFGSSTQNQRIVLVGAEGTMVAVSPADGQTTTSLASKSLKGTTLTGLIPMGNRIVYTGDTGIRVIGTSP